MNYKFNIFITQFERLSFTDLEWKMIYVGSAESEEYDQILDSVFVGPIPEGKHMFVFQVRVNSCTPEQYRFLYVF